MTALAALSSYVLVAYRSDLLLYSRQGYVATFFLAWTFELLGLLVWRVILWPKFFSPLRHLPGPTGNSWWNGQYARISAEPTGVPMIDWYKRLTGVWCDKQKPLTFTQGELYPTRGPHSLSRHLKF